MSSEFLYSVETTATDADGNIVTTYSNEVTADDLNNIAVDLGYAEFAVSDTKFKDATEYTVNALNNITAALTTKGVLQIGNKCQVSFDTNTNETTISDGVIVFSDGSKRRIEGVATIPGTNYNSSVTNYVYFKRDEAGNKIVGYRSIYKPTSGDYIMLAEIGADGKVTDMREWSVSKTSNGTNIVKEYDVDIPWLFDTAEKCTHSVTFDVSPIDANFAIYQSSESYDEFEGNLIAAPLIDDGTTDEYRIDDRTFFSFTKHSGAITVTCRMSMLYGSAGNFSTKLYFV